MHSVIKTSGQQRSYIEAFAATAFPGTWKHTCACNSWKSEFFSGGGREKRRVYWTA